MNRIKIPFLPTLDVIDLTSAGFVMETKAKRFFVNEINWETYPYNPITVVDIARSSKMLFLRFFVKGNSLKAIYKDDDSPVHMDSCVEFFMKRVEDDFYYNFEFNCIGTCDAARRKSRTEKESLSPEEYASIQRYPSLERKPFLEKEGVYSWELAVAIPFTLMGIDPDNLPEKILANFYKCADDTKYSHYVSWNPIETEQPDFHRPEFFGELYL